MNERAEIVEMKSRGSKNDGRIVADSKNKVYAKALLAWTPDTSSHDFSANVDDALDFESETLLTPCLREDIHRPTRIRSIQYSLQIIATW